MNISYMWRLGIILILYEEKRGCGIFIVPGICTYSHSSDYWIQEKSPAIPNDNQAWFSISNVLPNWDKTYFSYFKRENRNIFGTFTTKCRKKKNWKKKMNFEINCKIDQNNPFRQLFFDGLFLLNFYRRQLFAAEQDIKWQCKRSYMFGRKINSKPF